jgi:general secretion pathway protein G
MRMKTEHTCRGFTLLELMLIVALLGILAAIAVPTYKSTVERTRTDRAIADIASLSVKIDRFELNSGALPDTLVEAGIEDAVDPWGRAYAYLNLVDAGVGDSRKNGALNPINTDYDLYSVGPDGESRKPLMAAASRDDIVRANDGAFIGKAQDY